MHLFEYKKFFILQPKYRKCFESLILDSYANKYKFAGLPITFFPENVFTSHFVVVVVVEIFCLIFQV